MNNRFKNQTGIIRPSILEDKKFLVIGAGAIGSFTVMTLAKMGAKNITVWDNDTIEEHNISNQMYPIRALERPKADVLQEVVGTFSDTIIEPRIGTWEGPESSQDAPGVVIVATDNMKARKAAWDAYKAIPGLLFIDGRMGAQVYRAYGVNTDIEDQKAYYEKSLYTSEEATPDPCGAKSIIYNVLGVSAALLNMIKKNLNKERCPIEVTYDFVNDLGYSTYRPKEVRPIEDEIETFEEALA